MNACMHRLTGNCVSKESHRSKDGCNSQVNTGHIFRMTNWVTILALYRMIQNLLHSPLPVIILYKMALRLQSIRLAFQVIVRPNLTFGKWNRREKTLLTTQIVFVLSFVSCTRALVKFATYKILT